jgi:hypothetical protein
MMKFSIGVKKEGARASEPRYAKRNSDYAVIYDREPRTIKRWKARGRAAVDPPPLDDPQAMPAWHLRMGKPMPPNPQSELVEIKQKDTRRHARYAKPLSYYANFHEVPLRTLKRYVHRSKQIGDSLPLGDHDKFKQWVARNLDGRGGHATPDKVQPGMTEWLIPPDKS